jgi:hypothetical protein
MPEACIMIMRFDPSNAEMTKFGDTYSSSKVNLAAARRDAANAASDAGAKGLSFQYLVVRVDSEAAFASYELPE